jgi:hypothetical protein
MRLDWHSKLKISPSGPETLVEPHPDPVLLVDILVHEGFELARGLLDWR